ncbi:hypothetical protein [Microcystis phage Mwe-Yong1]|nr:hypothetical protein [Microcystis phage Mwe-Yong1]
MALIDRIRERTGTDLSDDELEAMIAGVTAEITDRFGPAGEITVTLGDPLEQQRWQKTLSLIRPLDQAEPVTIVEIDPHDTGDAGAEVTLAADDYRVLHGGRTLQRLTGGTHGESFWAPMVQITYTPIGQAVARDEVTIKLIQLDLSYRGLIKSERAGDYQWQASLASDSYATERANILASLAVGGRMVMS